MADEKPSGLLAAVRELMADHAGEMYEQQLALLPTPATERVEVPEAGEDGKRRGPGRPPGAKNKSTLDWARYIQARYRDPRLFLAETYNRPVEQLAKELDCSLLDAFRVQFMAAKEIAPYIASKMPTADDDGGKEIPSLALYVSDEGAKLIQASAQGGARMIEGEVIQPGGDPEDAGSQAGDDNAGKSDT